MAAFAGEPALARRLAAGLMAEEATPVVRRYHDGGADYGVAGERLTAGLFLPPMARLWRAGLPAAAGLRGDWRAAGPPDACADGGCVGVGAQAGSSSSPGSVSVSMVRWASAE